jgi:hypothetical protein
MTLTADDVQGMVTHWLRTDPNGYLGSGYGAPVADLLQTPMASGRAEAFLDKLRTDVPILAQLPEDAVNLYSRPREPDRIDFFIEVSGALIRVGDEQTVAADDIR